MAFIWIIVFVLSLVVLVKGADWLLDSAERIGFALGLSPFIIGAVIAGVGTSFPELISSIAAVLQGAEEIVVANAMGSNIANILLIVGISSVIGRQLTVAKSLIDVELPLLAASTALLLAVVWDRQVNRIEATILLLGYIVYLFYTLIHRDEDEVPKKERFLFLRRLWRNIEKPDEEEISQSKKIQAKDVIVLLAGIAGLVLGSKYLIDSVVALSSIYQIATGAIAITAVAFGTSLPELLVSGKAALRQKSEIALGNIFGSNAFNALVVVGLPAMIRNLPLDDPTFMVGLPAFVIATFLFIIAGISKRIHIWEGLMFLLVYALFIGKLFSLF